MTHDEKSFEEPLNAEDIFRIKAAPLLSRAYDKGYETGYLAAHDKQAELVRELVKMLRILVAPSTKDTDYDKARKLLANPKLKEI